jgi:aryl-alcohol dehydrogenase-like predicted oxidoreductase
MQTKRFGEYDLSRMMLGTVQFGMPYGIANTDGQPDYRQVLGIVEAAIEGGVNCFDTAAAYGSSEEVLGRALRELDVLEEVMVVTKVQHLSREDRADAATAKRLIVQSVEASRRRLGMDSLPVVLFHKEADAEYMDVLLSLKERGWLRHAGVSCGNEPGGAVRLAQQPGVEALQVPANLLDRRHQQSGALEAASSHGTAAFVRSVFLQGLLLMPEDRIPDGLREVVPVRRQLDRISRRAGLSAPELAIRYMLSQDGVTCVLTGVESAEQVRDNIAIFGHGPLEADILRAVKVAVPDLPEKVITPSMWQ